MDDLPIEHTAVLNLFTSILENAFISFMVMPTILTTEDKKAIFRDISMRFIEYLIPSYLERSAQQQKQIAEQAVPQFLLALSVALEKQERVICGQSKQN